MSGGREWLGRRLAAMLETTRRMRPGTREVARHYAAGRRFRAASAGWDAGQRDRHVRQQLQRVLQHAATTTEFYAARVREAGLDLSRPVSHEAFAEFPILERDDVARDAATMLSSAVPPGERRRDGTGGSTGVPLQYWSGPEERGWRLSGQDGFMEALGVGRGARIAFLWGHHIDSRERTQWREQLRDLVTNRRWFDCFRLSPEILLEYHRQMTEFAPSAIVAYASALDAMASAMLAEGLRAPYPSRRVVTGAEKLWPQQRARVEAAFAAPVHERYGSRDVGFIAGQLDGRAAAPLVVDWANLLVEPESDDPLSAILVTKLHADAMPMIRYRVGDVARFPEGSGPGRPVWELPEVIGRQLDGLHLPDGRWVHGVGIPHLMKEQPLHEFQIRQQADYSVDVLIVPNEHYTSAAGEDILRVLAENLPGVPLRLLSVEAIERTAANKWRPVITLVNRAAGTAAVKETA